MRRGDESHVVSVSRFATPMALGGMRRQFGAFCSAALVVAHLLSLGCGGRVTLATDLDANGSGSAMGRPNSPDGAGEGPSGGPSGPSGAGGPKGTDATTHPSCQGVAAICGPDESSDCCSSSVIPGGTFLRSYDGVNYTDQGYPATLSAFRLDTYEITVGRFREFVEAGYGTSANPPAHGSGANPNNPQDQGWESRWSSMLAPNTGALTSQIKCDPTYQASHEAWTDSPSSNESKPINCISWFEAFAFCVWDGGRLPSEAEWNYAASAGNEQRVYPWSNPPDSTTIQAGLAVYCSSEPGSCDLLRNVGTASPRGDGKWGHADLSGSVWEWARDWFDALPVNPCKDCAQLTGSSSRVVRGGCFTSDASGLFASARGNCRPSSRNSAIGGRCARSP
jgi:formylglycine-generating enzyme